MGVVDHAQKRFAKGVASFADQIGVRDARKIRFQRLDAPFLGLPAGDPMDALVAAERLRGRIGVGCLAVVDVGGAVDHRDDLLAVGQSAETGKTGSRACAAGATGNGGGIGGSGVLPVVGAGQGGDIAEVAGDIVAAIGIVVKNPTNYVDAAAHRPGARYRDEALGALAGQLVIDLLAVFIVDADDRGAA